MSVSTHRPWSRCPEAFNIPLPRLLLTEQSDWTSPGQRATMPITNVELATVVEIWGFNWYGCGVGVLLGWLRGGTMHFPCVSGLPLRKGWAPHFNAIAAHLLCSLLGKDRSAATHVKSPHHWHGPIGNHPCQIPTSNPILLFPILANDFQHSPAFSRTR